MNQAIRSVITSLAVAVCLSQTAATYAQAGPPAETLLTVDQVRSAFASAGFQVDPAHNWDWTSPPVSTFPVHDQANGRVLLALMYTNSASARRARLQAQIHELELNPGNRSDHDDARLSPHPRQMVLNKLTTPVRVVVGAANPLPRSESPFR